MPASWRPSHQRARGRNQTLDCNNSSELPTPPTVCQLISAMTTRAAPRRQSADPAAQQPAGTVPRAASAGPNHVGDM